MSRELVLRRWCDVCRLTAGDQGVDDDPRVPATVSFTVGVNEGESRPVPKVIDVCDDHTGALEDLVTLMAQIHQLPGDEPKVTRSRVPTAAVAPSRPGEGLTPVSECPVCHEDFTSLVMHIWNVHRPDSKPPSPTKCPDCGKRYNTGSGMSAHRRFLHGFDALADALSGVPGYHPSREITTTQMELTG